MCRIAVFAIGALLIAFALPDGLSPAHQAAAGLPCVTIEEHDHKKGDTTEKSYNCIGYRDGCVGWAAGTDRQTSNEDYEQENSSSGCAGYDENTACVGFSSQTYSKYTPAGGETKENWDNHCDNYLPA